MLSNLAPLLTQTKDSLPSRFGFVVMDAQEGKTLEDNPDTVKLSQLPCHQLFHLNNRLGHIVQSKGSIQYLDIP